MNITLWKGENPIFSTELPKGMKFTMASDVASILANVAHSTKQKFGFALVDRVELVASKKKRTIKLDESFTPLEYEKSAGAESFREEMEQRFADMSKVADEITPKPSLDLITL